MAEEVPVDQLPAAVKEAVESFVKDRLTKVGQVKDNQKDSDEALGSTDLKPQKKLDLRSLFSSALANGSRPRSPLTRLTKVLVHKSQMKIWVLLIPTLCFAGGAIFSLPNGPGIWNVVQHSTKSSWGSCTDSLGLALATAPHSNWRQHD